MFLELELWKKKKECALKCNLVNNISISMLICIYLLLSLITKQQEKELVSDEELYILFFFYLIIDVNNTTYFQTNVFSIV